MSVPLNARWMKIGLDVPSVVGPGRVYFQTCIEGYIKEDTN